MAWRKRGMAEKSFSFFVLFLVLAPDGLENEDEKEKENDWFWLTFLYTDKRTSLFSWPAGRCWTPGAARSYGAGRMIKQIKFISIPVKDQNRALDFYTEKLG